MRLEYEIKFLSFRKEMRSILIENFFVDSFIHKSYEELNEDELEELNIDVYEVYSQICSNSAFSWEFFEANPKIKNWLSLCQNENLPWQYFEKYLDMLDFRILLANKNIPQSFFERHWDKLKYLPTDALSNPNLSDEFIERLANKVEMDPKYSRNRNLNPAQYPITIEARFRILVEPETTLEFTENFLAEIRQNSPELIEKFYLAVSQNDKLPWQFFEHHYGEIRTIAMTNELIKTHLSRNSALPISFFEQHPRIIDWESLASNPFTYQFRIENE